MKWLKNESNNVSCCLVFSLTFCFRTSISYHLGFQYKQADAEDWEGPDAQRKTCKWTIDLKEGVFQAKGLADEGTAFVKKTAWKDDWLDYTLEVKVRNMGTKNHFGIGFRENRVGHHYGFYMNDFAGAETKYWFGIWNGGYTALAGSWGEDGNYKDAEE